MVQYHQSKNPQTITSGELEAQGYDVSNQIKEIILMILKFKMILPKQLEIMMRQQVELIQNIN